MIVKSFDFNEVPGVFRVFADDGSAVLDSRFPSQRLHQTGVVTATGRTMIYDGTNYWLVMSTPTYVPFNKTFAKPPYVLSCSRPLDDKDQTGMSQTDRITSPYMYSNNNYLANYVVAYSGHFTNAGLSGMNIGNLNFNDTIGGLGGSNGQRRVWYSVFENGIS